MEKTCDRNKSLADWQVCENLKYDANNFWVKVEGGQASIGLTDYGQWVIGDILYLELAQEGASIEKGGRFGSIESGKWVGNLVSPVNGSVVESNAAVSADPRHVNLDPYGTGWMMKVALEPGKDLGHLMDFAAYQEWMKEQELKQKEI